MVKASKYMGSKDFIVFHRAQIADEKAQIADKKAQIMFFSCHFGEKA